MWVSVLHVALCATAMTHALTPSKVNDLKPMRFCCSDTPCGGKCLKGYCPYSSIEIPLPMCRCPYGYKCCRRVIFPTLTPCEKCNSMYKCVPLNVFCAVTVGWESCVCPQGLKCCKGPFCFECGGRCIRGHCKRPFYPVNSSQCKCPMGMSCCKVKFVP